MKVVVVFFSQLLTPGYDFNEDAVKCFSFPIPGTTRKSNYVCFTYAEDAESRMPDSHDDFHKKESGH